MPSSSASAANITNADFFGQTPSHRVKSYSPASYEAASYHYDAPSYNAASNSASASSNSTTNPTNADDDLFGKDQFPFDGSDSFF